MGGRNIRAAGVFKAVSHELKTPLMRNRPTPTPPWYEAMRRVPPAESLIRTVPVSHRPTNPKAKRPKNIFRPQPIFYTEDALRTSFYKDHPWELARPRMVLELDGKDHQHCDWSKGLRQPGVPLSGECVVQRQLWLMQNEGMSKRKAYDITRREFYRMRQEEDIERRVSIEEARHVGAYFGKNRLDVGMQLEDQEFENWKVWAGKETKDAESKREAETDSYDVETEIEEAEPTAAPPA